MVQVMVLQRNRLTAVFPLRQLGSLPTLVRGGFEAQHTNNPVVITRQTATWIYGATPKMQIVSLSMTNLAIIIQSLTIARKYGSTSNQGKEVHHHASVSPLHCLQSTPLVCW